MRRMTDFELQDAIMRSLHASILERGGTARRPSRIAMESDYPEVTRIWIEEPERFWNALYALRDSERVTLDEQVLGIYVTPK